VYRKGLTEFGIVDGGFCGLGLNIDMTMIRHGISVIMKRQHKVIVNLFLLKIFPLGFVAGL
jgi:hypothetical protein